MKTFRLSELQAEAILDLRLRKLAKLEEVRIQGELKDLEAERKTLKQVLGSSARLKTLIKKEIKADAETFGDKRRSPLVERQEARAIDEKELIPTEPVTVILSEKGWVRAAKGHDIDPAALAYRAGDSFKQAGLGRTNQYAVFIDSTGRCYALANHALPSARGLGDPLSSHVNPPDGATFEGVMTGDPEEVYLLASDAGYGFMARLEDLVTRNKNGKAALNVPKGAGVLSPALVGDPLQDFVAAVTSSGRMLVTDLKELPLLGKGKGLKIIQIPPARLKSREEFVVAMTCFAEGDHLVVHSGKRHITLKPEIIDNFYGERGRRGNVLPRGFRQVSRITVAGQAGAGGQPAADPKDKPA